MKTRSIISNMKIFLNYLIKNRLTIIYILAFGKRQGDVSFVMFR